MLAKVIANMENGKVNLHNESSLSDWAPEWTTFSSFATRQISCGSKLYMCVCFWKYVQLLNLPEEFEYAKRYSPQLNAFVFYSAAITVEPSCKYIQYENCGILKKDDSLLRRFV